MITDESTAGSVEAAEAARLRALLEADLDTLARLTAEEYLHVETGGTTRDRAGFLAAMARPDHRFVQWIIDEARIDRHGDVAVVSGSYRNQLRSPAGLQPVKQARFLRVWVLRDGAWRNIVHQATAITPPSPSPSA